MSIAATNATRLFIVLHIDSRHRDVPSDTTHDKALVFLSINRTEATLNSNFGPARQAIGPRTLLLERLLI